jgi:hypothetical protein
VSQTEEFKPPSLARRMLGNLDMPKIYLRSLVGGMRNRKLYAGVPKYCMFIGHPRSGHSLVGSLLDAHPEMVIAHELDVIRYVRLNFSKNQLFDLIIRHDKEFTSSGRQWTGYNYTVPGQWQGKFRSLEVIGDKKGGDSTLQLRQNPGLLDKLEAKLNMPMLGIHVQRNPFDNIATISIKDNKTLDRAIDFYFELQETNGKLEEWFGDRILVFRHEALIESPKEHLSMLATHLGVAEDQSWIDACADVLFDSPNKSRHKVEWPTEAIDKVHSRIADHAELAGYSFEG